MARPAERRISGEMGINVLPCRSIPKEVPKLAEIGSTMMCEQRSPKDLVNYLIHAERAGFDFSVISDHFHPWLEEQGHSGYAWSILGAAAQATERIPLMTYVT